MLVINDTAYAGEVASQFISPAVTDSDTVNKGCCYVEDGIKKKKTIPKIDVSKFMQKRKPTPTPGQGKVQVDGGVLEPQDAMLYYEFDPRDFEQHWIAQQLPDKLIESELPATVENFMLMQTMARLNEFWESSLWRSRKDYDPEGANVDPTTKGESADASDFIYFDGWIKKALDNANTIQIAAPVALTDANILAKLALALGKIPKALLYKYGNAGVKFLMSNADKQKYDNALIALPNKSIDPSQAGVKFYQGYNVETLAGMPENTFFVCICKPDLNSNLWVGMNSVDDNQLQLQRLQANSELFFVKGLFKIDTQIGYAEQLVVYTTLVA